MLRSSLLLLVLALLLALTARSLEIRADDPAIKNLQVLLFSTPSLQVNVSFTHLGEKHDFFNMQLVQPISSATSTTFQFAPHFSTDSASRRKKWATLTLLPENRVSGLFSYTASLPDSNKYTVEINTNYLTNDISRKLAAELEEGGGGGAMDKSKKATAWCGSSSKQSERRPPVDPEGKDPKPVVMLDDEEEDDYNEEDEFRARRLEVLQWANKGDECFPRDDIPRRVHIGIAYDQSFAARSKLEGYSSPHKLIEIAVAKASAVYLAQMNIQLQVDAVFDFAQVSNTEGLALTSPSRTQLDAKRCNAKRDQFSMEILELACCDDGKFIDERLTVLRAWANTLPLRSNTAGGPKRLAHWHLFTDCHPTPGYVGRADIGTLCHASMGVGLTSFGPELTPNAALWRIFAHELGHAFNATHSFEMGMGKTGGIMDYGDGLYLGDYQFHYLKHDAVCSEIAANVDTCAFINLADSRCGDGFVDGKLGEECDCGPNPSDTCLLDCTRECTLRPTSACIRNDQCCTETGRFALANELVCTTAQNTPGVCIAGQCMGSGICVNSAPAVCEAISSCQVACGANCNVIVPLPNGIACEDGGSCMLGKCVPPTTTDDVVTSPPPVACVDARDVWWDADGPNFNCAWYAKRVDRCNSYGFRGKNFGMTAMEACCVCGGGRSPNATKAVRTGRPTTTIPSTTPTLTPTVELQVSQPTTDKNETLPENGTAPPTARMDEFDTCPQMTAALRCRSRGKRLKACGALSNCVFCKVESKAILKKYRKKKLCVPGNTCEEAARCALL